MLWSNNLYKMHLWGGAHQINQGGNESVLLSFYISFVLFFRKGFFSPHRECWFVQGWWVHLQDSTILNYTTAEQARASSASACIHGNGRFRLLVESHSFPATHTRLHLIWMDQTTVSGGNQAKWIENYNSDMFCAALENKKRFEL